jgi:hypothetical protein
MAKLRIFKHIEKPYQIPKSTGWKKTATKRTSAAEVVDAAVQKFTLDGVQFVGISGRHIGRENVGLQFL